MKYGYIRVSTKEQNEARQVCAMKAFGLTEQQLLIDKQSGKDFLRPAYQNMIRTLNKGDTVVIQSIDRLGRNYTEIIEQWHVITKKKGAQIVVLDMPLLDTRQNGMDFTGVFIADLVLQILSYVAQAERENIRKRQAEGIAAAKAKGVRFGRPTMALPTNFATVCQQHQNGEITATIAAQQLGVSRTTYMRWLHAKTDI